MNGPCRKRRYRDELAAKMALASKSRRDGSRPKEETRAYPCRQCHGAWHLTSQPAKTSDPRGSMHE
jgi:hypothetical protein